MTDEITSLPGAPKFLSRQYSGFLPISASKDIHYYYIESERNPVNDTIVFWTNGGPGCSGLLGMFLETGPWRVQADGTLISNPASWTGLASMVFLEQPAGVGFRYYCSYFLLLFTLITHVHHHRSYHDMSASTV